MVHHMFESHDYENYYNITHSHMYTFIFIIKISNNKNTLIWKE